MKCIICHTDISNPELQYGRVGNLCVSDFLAGNEWVNDEPVIVDYLTRGFGLDEAQKFAIKEEMTELEIFARGFFIEVLG